MKAKVIKADTAGEIVQFSEDEIYYVGEHYGDNDGTVYKNQEAFDEDCGICYIPECGFFDRISPVLATDNLCKYMHQTGNSAVSDGAGGYTRDDIYAAMYNHMDYDGIIERMEDEYGKPLVNEFIDEETAYVFREVDWQCPETFIEEMDWEADWEDFLKNK